MIEIMLGLLLVGVGLKFIFKLWLSLHRPWSSPDF